MNTTTMELTVGELVSERPRRSRVFEDYGIDYCCGGKKLLAEACVKKGVAFDEVLRQLADSDAVQENTVDYNIMALDELVNHIVSTHHEYLSQELPRLENISEKVAKVHGGTDARLCKLAQVVQGLSAELQSHMMKEERVLFPIIRQLAHADTLPLMPCGALVNPIRAMEAEHDTASGSLESMRQLTDGYTPPEWACNTYRALLDRLHELELDLHQHIHKENNILFPKALELEASLPHH
ncbi:MAG TPA: iron-sulfur cluster repair di-iron protein [Verrucomicrobiales bacterium]|nr:iron-sulfur cluster repair di-iron protein [Verrucomicrobiales bacterium]